MPEQKPLKILFLMEDLCFGGTQKQNMELATRLDGSKFQPEVLTLTGPTDIDGMLQKAGIPLRHMGSSRKAAPFFFIRLAKYLAQIKPDILVPCTALPNIWGRIWGKILKTPVIVGTVRGGGAPMRQHEWLLWRLANGIVCNSRQLVEAMGKRGAPMDRLRYIANGVDTDHFRPAPKNTDAPLILCVARLAADKDHKTLLRAFAHTAKVFPKARLRLVGEGPEEAALRQFVAAEMPEDFARRVEFAGASADPAPHLAEASIFALSSIREGQPNVIMEAMAAGLPICASNVGGIPALVENCGLLCDAGDAEAMSANFNTLLKNSALAAEMGARGRDICVDNYSFANMVNKHEKFFLELWQKHGAKNK